MRTVCPASPTSLAAGNVSGWASPGRWPPLPRSWFVMSQSPLWMSLCRLPSWTYSSSSSKSLASPIFLLPMICPWYSISATASLWCTGAGLWKAAATKRSAPVPGILTPSIWLMPFRLQIPACHAVLCGAPRPRRNPKPAVLTIPVV